MTPQACQAAAQNVGEGIGSSLRAVDCAASQMAQAAFGRLFGAEGALVPALTILLTLFIAFFAFSLITGRSRIGISSLVPRMTTLGLVLTFATSWLAYQSVVWNLATGAPDQIAGILLGGSGSATQVFADKIDVVFGVLIEVGQGQQPESTFSPPGLLWLGATVFLLSTVGVLATSKIAMALLLGLGPIFVVLALFNGTRGLFVGWLKGVVLLALAPLFAVLGGSLMLELSVPVLSALSATPGQIDPRAAMAFFMIGAVHAALMVLVLKVAATMVAGWSVFGMVETKSSETVSTGSDRIRASAATRNADASAAARMAGGNAAPATARRDVRMTHSAPMPANDQGSSVSGRGTRIIQQVVSGQTVPNSQLTPSRTKGLGTRFRAPPARVSEKLK